MPTKRLSRGPKSGPSIELRLYIGALCPPIATQLRKQKLKFDLEKVKHLQKDVDAWVRLKIRYNLPAAFSRKLPELIWKKVAAHVAEMN